MPKIDKEQSLNPLACSNISSLFIGLFPYHARVQVRSIDWLPENLNEDLENYPTNISELIKFIRAFGKPAITYLRLTFLPNNGLVIFRDGEATIHDLQESYRAHFLSEFEHFLNHP